MHGIDLTQVSNWIGLSAALGVAAMGLVEALKWTRLGLFGLGKVRELLGTGGMSVLERAYGPGLDVLLEGAFRKGAADLAEVLRNGLRVGLSGTNAGGVAAQFGQDAAELQAAVAALHAPNAPAVDSAAAGVIARMHLAIDARVDAAIAAAHEVYLGALRIAATIIALAGTLAVYGIEIGYSFGSWRDPELWKAIVIAVVAVPIAPIAKDLVNVLRSAKGVLGSRA